MSNVTASKVTYDAFGQLHDGSRGLRSKSFNYNIEVFFTSVVSTTYAASQQEISFLEFVIWVCCSFLSLTLILQFILIPRVHSFLFTYIILSRIATESLARRQYRVRLGLQRLLNSKWEGADSPIAPVLQRNFTYPDLAPGHARFLRLKCTLGTIAGSLESHNLDTPPSYVAISYCWGDPSLSHSIMLDNANLAITQTLAEALRHLEKLFGGSSLIWIDQICIDQDDSAEKVDQISRLGEIYHLAQKVVIWLGPSAQDSDIVMKNLHSTQKILDNITALEMALRSPILRYLVDPEELYAYGRFFTRPWFLRLWTVQEALLGQDVSVACGNHFVPWRHIASLSDDLAYFQVITPVTPPELEYGRCEHLYDPLSTTSIIQEFRQKGMIGPRLHEKQFFVLVDIARSRQCSLPEDRVLALLGVAPTPIHTQMVRILRREPDQVLEKLYMHFMKILLETDLAFQYLGSVYAEQTMESLPSWCPNFKSPYPRMRRFVHEGYSAVSSSDALGRMSVTCSVESQVVTVAGFQLDRVQVVIPPGGYPIASSLRKNERKESEQRRAGIVAWSRNVSPSRKLSTKDQENIPDAHWQTLVGGRDRLYHKEVTRRGYQLYRLSKQIPSGKESRTWHESLSTDEAADLHYYMGAEEIFCTGRVYMSTGGGRLALGPPGARKGDAVCMFYGATVPFVLRETKGGKYTLVGDAYVHGVMKGEALGSIAYDCEQRFEII